MSKRFCRSFLACATLIGLAASASAEMDSKTRDSMRRMHKSLLIAEQNLKQAIKKKDLSRAILVHELLDTYVSAEAFAEPDSCTEAHTGLISTAIAVVFDLHPVSEDQFDRFSKAMRPSQEGLMKWYDEGTSLYRTKMPLCEEAIGARAKSPRLLPEKMPLTR
jgi:hypothetical protein